ncbi:hypothetical protein JA1_000225 [Spathaspora sp. JA1]|nr:hypothetical protein JA1_000225 [Spathaspora sp. JA1]
MYLPSTLIEKIHQQHATNELGNLFMNPSLSFVITKIIWKLEDELGVSERHQGPISRGSVMEMNEGGWINKNYDDLKVEIVKRLERVGVEGVVQLLYSSLKQLATERASSAELSAERERS